MRAGRAALLSLLAGIGLGSCQVQQAPDAGGATAGDAAPERPRMEILQVEGVLSLPVFSSAVRAGDFLFLSGMVGTVGNTRTLAEGGAAAEARQTMENIRLILDAAGASFEDVVKCTVFLADIGDYAAVNGVYAEYFPSRPPARSAVAGSGIALGARVEIVCLALAVD